MPRPISYEKSVYILGAGFSVDAGGPSQDSILKKVIELHVEKGKVHERIGKRKASLVKFLTETLEIPAANLSEISLEDVYTTIDRCLADHVSLRGHSQTDLEAIRNDLDYLIATVIKEEFRLSSKPKDYVDKLASFLVKKAAVRRDVVAGEANADKAKRCDPFSIISLNWDILLDNSIDAALRRHDFLSEFHDYDPFGIVDYCCYVSSVEEDDRRIRSGLWTLGCRGYNVKVLKIHGSLNWLQCTNCQRLFTSFNQKLVVSEKINTPCRHCRKHDINAKLRGTLIMPTFLKDLSNFQLKLVWQNAGVELMEASRIYFVGYSLPHADFEFRQLLTRMVHREATIHVVLHKKSNPRRYLDEQKRYEQFFSGRNLSFDDKGAIHFVNEHVAGRC